MSFSCHSILLIEKSRNMRRTVSSRIFTHIRIVRLYGICHHAFRFISVSETDSGGGGGARVIVVGSVHHGSVPPPPQSKGPAAQPRTICPPMERSTTPVPITMRLIYPNLQLRNSVYVTTVNVIVSMPRIHVSRRRYTWNG